MIAEIVFHTYCGISIKTVETFRITVNSVIHKAVEIIITRGLYGFCCPSVHHKITGNTGNTHGASTLIIHARNEIRRSDILHIRI